MRIVHIAAEMAPFAKVGGLGDVVGGLAKEMAKEHEVEVILPRYSFLKFQTFSMKYQNFQCYEKGTLHENIALQIIYDNINLSFIEPHNEISYFNRSNIYGYSDDNPRFIYFSRAALEYLLKKNNSIDILHIHDWHTSLTAVLYKDLFQNLGLKIKKIVLNIHNIEYQGICAKWDLDRIGLMSKKYLSSTLSQQKAFPTNKINLLKCGITFSDAVIAVSPTYAKEITTKQYGYGLERILKENKDKLYGILNGIDNNIWNPQIDPNIPYHYSSNSSAEKIIEQKQKNKDHLYEMARLNPSHKPLICNIGRLVPQKGPALIEQAIFTTIKNRGQFILLGSSMIRKIKKQFSNLEKNHHLRGEVSFNFTYDEVLSHLIYAASDFIIVPSLFEPCGLTQMLALRYGTIPIVRKTGGLSDTVFDIDDKSFSQEKINGFTFERFDKDAMDKTLHRALSYWYNEKQKIFRLIENGVKTNHSLEKTAKEYLQLYKQLINS